MSGCQKKVPTRPAPMIRLARRIHLEKTSVAYLDIVNAENFNVLRTVGCLSTVVAQTSPVYYLTDLNFMLLLDTFFQSWTGFKDSC